MFSSPQPRTTVSQLKYTNMKSADCSTSKQSVMQLLTAILIGDIFGLHCWWPV